MHSEERFLICNLGKTSRLVGSPECFIFQIKEKANWKDKFYWYSIGDMIRGYINYASKTNYNLINQSGTKALLELLEKLEERFELACDRFIDVFDLDPVEKHIKEIKCEDLHEEE